MAEYLLECGDRTRHAAKLPQGAWDALVHYTADATALVRLGQSAEHRLQLRTASRCYHAALSAGESTAVASLVDLLEMQCRFGDAADVLQTSPVVDGKGVRWRTVGLLLNAGRYDAADDELGRALEDRETLSSEAVVYLARGISANPLRPLTDRAHRDRRRSATPAGMSELHAAGKQGSTTAKLRLAGLDGEAGRFEAFEEMMASNTFKNLLAQPLQQLRPSSDAGFEQIAHLLALGIKGTVEHDIRDKVPQLHRLAAWTAELPDAFWVHLYGLAFRMRPRMSQWNSLTDWYLDIASTVFSEGADKRILARTEGRQSVQDFMMQVVENWQLIGVNSGDWQARHELLEIWRWRGDHSKAEAAESYGFDATGAIAAPWW